MAEPTFFTHDEIIAVISDIIPSSNFLLDSFGQEHLSPDQQINFDKIEDDKRIAVFVNPRRPGEVIKNRGHEVRSYQPGYIKDKRTIDPKHVFSRKAGQPMNTVISPAERYAATVVDLSLLQIAALYRTLQLMASQLLLDGKYNMKGKDLDVEVDFDRKADNTVTLTTTARWLGANANVSPVDDVEEWLTRITSSAQKLVFGKLAWKAFRADPKFKEAVSLEANRGLPQNLSQMPTQNGMEDVTSRGTLLGADLPMFTYNGTYTDPSTGNDTLFVPDDAVLLIPSANFGYQCFAPIWDAAANFETMPYFVKNWEEQDPGIPYLLLQSAPMIAHSRINGSLSARTGADGS